MVILTYQDGSHICFADAFFVSVGAFIEVYTEHHGYHKFFRDNLISCAAGPPLNLDWMEK